MNFAELDGRLQAGLLHLRAVVLVAGAKPHHGTALEEVALLVAVELDRSQGLL